MGFILLRNSLIIENINYYKLQAKNLKNTFANKKRIRAKLKEMITTYLAISFMHFIVENKLILSNTTYQLKFVYLFKLKTVAYFFNQILYLYEVFFNF